MEVRGRLNSFAKAEGLSPAASLAIILGVQLEHNAKYPHLDFNFNKRRRENMPC